MINRRSFLSALPAVMAVPVIGESKPEPTSIRREPITGVVGLPDGDVLLCTVTGKLYTSDGKPFLLDPRNRTLAEYYAPLPGPKSILRPRPGDFGVI